MEGPDKKDDLLYFARYHPYMQKTTKDMAYHILRKGYSLSQACFLFKL